MEHALQSLYLFTGTMTLTSALHVGGGSINTMNTDSTVVRTPEGLPYIPGSSFKGVFRSTVEKLAGALSDIQTCALSGGKDCFHRKRQQEKGWFERIKTEVKEKANGDMELREKLLYIEVLKELCDTCLVFGNGFTASKIFFSDLYLRPGEWAGVTQIRDGVVIDRDSEKAVEGLKYDFEVVPANAAFGFEIRVENPSPKELGLVCLGLNEFVSELGHLGGNRSRGLGNCTMTIDKAYSAVFTGETGASQLKKYLLHTTLDEKMSKIPNVAAFMKDSIEVLF